MGYTASIDYWLGFKVMMKIYSEKTIGDRKPDCIIFVDCEPSSIERSH